MKTIKCKCGRCNAELSAEESKISGPFYVEKDDGMHWLVCTNCGDRFKIHPIDYLTEV